MTLKEVRVNRRGADRVAAGHPWVYRSDLLNPGDATGGGVVRVLDGRNKRLGCAHYSSSSEIALRLLPFEMTAADKGFFRRMLNRAQEYRDVVVEETDAYRLAYSEADLLPGLIVDCYGDYIVIQTLSQGMETAKAALIAALEELYEPAGIIERNDPASRTHEGLERTVGVVAGESPGDLVIETNGVKMRADLLAGQKTGLFLDQRENWAVAAHYARGRALDCFTYDGGFALHMAQSCERVEAVDSSGPAVERVVKNATLNGLENVETREANVFDLLKESVLGRKRFDTIVLDPPAFAKSKRHIDAAARAYKEINLKALQLLERGGTLITCSCSHHFSEADLLAVVAEASIDAGKRVRVVERRTQARDHPILLTAPETHYLKCLVLQAV